MVYRVGSGLPCPRCKRPLLDDAGEQRCTDGHGTWLARSVLITLLDPARLSTISKGNPFRVTALPPTRCLVCKELLNDLYQGDREPIALGQCVEHGVWIEGADRDTFEEKYASVIGKTRRQREREAQELAEREREREREQREAAERVAARIHDDPIIVDLVYRVRALEAEVAALKRGKGE